MTEVVWDEDGEMMKLPTRPAIWSPPNPASPTHRCGTPYIGRSGSAVWRINLDLVALPRQTVPSSWL